MPEKILLGAASVVIPCYLPDYVGLLTDIEEVEGRMSGLPGESDEEFFVQREDPTR